MLLAISEQRVQHDAPHDEPDIAEHRRDASDQQPPLAGLLDLPHRDVAKDKRRSPTDRRQDEREDGYRIRSRRH